MPLRCVAIPLVFILVPLQAVFAQDPAADEAFFESRIRPVLAEQCYSCHSEGADKRKGGLWLDGPEHWKEGGDSGAVIVSRDPEASLLVKAVRYADPELQMPPSGKLSDAIIADFVEWVTRGAPAPKDEERKPDATAAKRTAEPLDVTAIARAHWSFVPPGEVVPPDVGRAVHPVDAFVLAGLEADGVRPAPRADADRLLRRLAFDLTGLPPSDDDMRSWRADSGEENWQRLVDRYLASPHYGEHQARHWLDLVRYADSNGLDENLAMAHAWRYRDWVVKAFNDDLPYDRFVIDQLAGDLMPDDADEALTSSRRAATGFLAMGPKMLAEQDKTKLVMDTVDEAIDVVSKTFLGVTVSCARCHDHKFDPVSAEDYYALAGIFKSTKLLANQAFVSKWNEVELASKKTIAARDAARKRLADAEVALAAERTKTRQRIATMWRREFAGWITQGRDLLPRVRLIEAESFARGNVHVDAENWGTKECVVVRTGRPERPLFAEYDLEGLEGERSGLLVRAAAQERRTIRVLWDDQEVNGGAAGRVSGSWHPDGQTWQWVGEVSVNGGRGRLRFESHDHLPHIDAFALVPLESTGALPPEVAAIAPLVLLRPSSAEAPIVGLLREAAGLEGTTFATALAGRAERAFGDGRASALLEGVLAEPLPRDFRDLAARHQTVFEVIAKQAAARRAKKTDGKDSGDPESEAIRRFLFDARSPFFVEDADVERHASKVERDKFGELAGTVDAARKEQPPEIPVAIGAEEGEIADVPVHIRGSHLNLKPGAVPRGAPRVLSAFAPMTAPAANASGRAEFAAWLVRPENPLTARVMVNRIWESHFGRGIVASSSNFGIRGDVPTQPELLDWLAHEFIAGGWSMKAMHRLIVTSETYRRTADPDPESASLDPENRLFARQNARRLPAEALRDGMLVAAATLDPTLGGSLLSIANGDYVTNDQSANAARYDHPRRTLYLPIVRNALNDLLSTFDYPDAGTSLERRSQTVDANQALFMLNSPLVVEQSRRLAARLESERLEDDAARVRRAYDLVFNRRAAENEVALALAFLHDATASDPDQGAVGAWRLFCQALFASNEYLFLE